MSEPPAIPIITSIADIGAGYDAVLCDVWGVVHNGVTAFPAACAALEALRTAGKTVVLLTNAPRPGHAVAKQLAGFGVPQSAYDLIVSSGDLTRALIAQHRSQPMFHLGTERDRALFKGQDVRLTDQREAEVIVCSNLFDDETETPETYRDMLADFAWREALMICANPDLKVERGERVLWCAGGLAQLYEQLGGKVIYAGKPHQPVYDLAMGEIARARGAAVPKSRVLAIGDGVATDIAGAAHYGVAAVFVASAVFAAQGLSPAVLATLFPTTEGAPIAAMTALR